jgi:hypothetical protein
MAKVYTGRVTIPGDKIDEYFALMKQAEQEREPLPFLRKNMLERRYVNIPE